jgi:hypothetical protein
MRIRFLVSALAAAALVGIVASHAADTKMSFFITSANPGKGADLGGLAGADAWCQKLATDAGVGTKTWRAYLSTTASGGQSAVNARDRIGKGPWYNAKGEQIAANLDELHGQNKLTKETNINEKSGVVNGSGDTPNTHDILTGSKPDGSVDGDATCSNWTSSSTGTAMLGHHDRKGTNPDPVANSSWNSSHRARGCSTEALASTGSGGLFYCFAAN